MSEKRELKEVFLTMYLKKEDHNMDNYNKIMEQMKKK